MKDKFYYLIVLMLISSGAFAQFSTKECTYCKSNELGNSSSAIGVENLSTGEFSFASGQANQ